MQPSNPNQFTERAWAAIATTTDLAKQRQHQQIETEHLMLALLDQDGLASRILQKAGASVGELRSATEAFLRKQPQVKGQTDTVYLGRALNTLLDRAEAGRPVFSAHRQRTGHAGRGI